MLTVTESCPRLPVGFKNGVAGIVEQHIFFGLGSAGKQFFCLDLKSDERAWQRVEDFPGPARNDAVCITTSTGLYIFSGAGKTQEHTPLQVLMDGYYFDAMTLSWQRLDTSIPVGLLGACGCELSAEQLVFFGGYCKETFDGFMAEISQYQPQSEPYQKLLTDFMSRPVDAYGWNQNILAYNPQSQQWKILERDPWPANCGAALIKYPDSALVIEGEIKPGLRSQMSKHFTFTRDAKVMCQPFPAIVDTDKTHEGLAGCFAGSNGQHILLAGGACFIGSQENYNKGLWYSHKGLEKHYNQRIWCFDGDKWYCAGMLPEGLAYGAAITTHKGMILLGGENKQGAATDNTWFIGFP